MLKDVGGEKNKNMGALCVANDDDNDEDVVLMMMMMDGWMYGWWEYGFTYGTY